MKGQRVNGWAQPGVSPGPHLCVPETRAGPGVRPGGNVTRGRSLPAQKSKMLREQKQVCGLKERAGWSREFRRSHRRGRAHTEPGPQGALHHVQMTGSHAWGKKITQSPENVRNYQIIRLGGSVKSETPPSLHPTRQINNVMGESQTIGTGCV